MAAIDATGRTTNAKARVYEHLSDMAITGSPAIVIEGMRRHRADKDREHIRVTWLDISETASGRYSATQSAKRRSFLLQCDVFWPDGSEESVHDAYAIERAADDLEHGLRELDLTFQDYSGDPANPTAVSGAAIRFSAVGRSGRTTEAGFDRIAVQADGYWFLRHTP